MRCMPREKSSGSSAPSSLPWKTVSITLHKMLNRLRNSAHPVSTTRQQKPPKLLSPSPPSLSNFAIRQWGLSKPIPLDPLFRFLYSLGVLSSFITTVAPWPAGITQPSPRRNLTNYGKTTTTASGFLLLTGFPVCISPLPLLRRGLAYMAGRLDRPAPGPPTEPMPGQARPAARDFGGYSGMAKAENVAYKRSQRAFFGREALPIEKSGFSTVRQNLGRNAARSLPRRSVEP
jgi:hypothetical protein